MGRGMQKKDDFLTLLTISSVSYHCLYFIVSFSRTVALLSFFPKCYIKMVREGHFSLTYFLTWGRVSSMYYFFN